MGVVALGAAAGVGVGGRVNGGIAGMMGGGGREGDM